MLKRLLRRPTLQQSLKTNHGLSSLLSRGYASSAAQKEYLNKHLSEIDPEVFDIIEKEKKRQRESI
ncbi:hypothetical protein GLOIN_2v1539409, partial [Rhizophagus irregularis DAOM 181602=DAOM 197198]